ncbi:MAG: YceI family protein [Rhodopila sp.]|nr:YceI family protein [Rhodopila sp.]
MRFILLLLVFLAGPALAEQINLLPPGSQVELRAYGLGLIPLDGKFTRFHGWMRYDPANPDACQVVLEIEAASLVMSEEAIRDEIIGPEFMDVSRFPDLTFHGNCQGDAVAGSLLLHGQTLPFSLDLTRSALTITATGHLRRADWGITARPFTAGPTIRIRVEIPNPGNGPHT